jgi:dynein heavy chain
VSNTVIDWFAKWPDQALHSVANAFVGDEQSIPEDFRKARAMSCCFLPLQAMVKHTVAVHLTVAKFSERYFEELRRHNYVTPKHFLDYIGKYLELLRENKKKIIDANKRYAGGLAVSRLQGF